LIVAIWWTNRTLSCDDGGLCQLAPRNGEKRGDLSSEPEPWKTFWMEDGDVGSENMNILADSGKKSTDRGQYVEKHW
jgi:hypothetical protein